MSYHSNQFFLGHSRSRERPECEIVDESKHARGGFISVVKHYNVDQFFICTRQNRKQRYITPFMPQRDFYIGENRHPDGDFEEYFYEWGFKTLEEAQKYFIHVMNTPDHPGVPKVSRKFWGRPQDSQRNKVYEWEVKFYKDRAFYGMTNEQIIALVREIERDFPITKRPVGVSFRQKGGCYFRGVSPGDVNFASYGRNRYTVVHEMAHWFEANTWETGTPRRASHGPEFVGIFMLLLERYCGCCLTDMINHAMNKNVRFVFPDGGLAPFEAPKDEATENDYQEALAA